MRAPLLASLLLAAWALTACGDVGASRAPVVYETDDRMEVYEHPSATHRAVAESAVAMQIEATSLDRSDPANVRITYTTTLGETASLCPDVRYQGQIDPGTCSGTLIDERHVLTAGHCVAAAEDCDGTSWPWVFGLYYEAPDRLRTLRADDVYQCQRTVVLRNDDAADYAVIELDRPVVGHAPARVRLAATDAPLGTPVTIIGHPNGIPMKIAGNATIRGASGIELYADVDAFFGNSGSGVLDDGGDVVGILVAGAPFDYRRRRGSGCDEVEVIDPAPEGDGEILTAVRAPMAAFCSERPASSACSGAAADGGLLTVDAGADPDPVDGGAPATGRRGGCRCGVPGARSASPPHALLLLGVLGAVLARRRRRHHAPG